MNQLLFMYFNSMQTKISSFDNSFSIKFEKQLERKGIETLSLDPRHHMGPRAPYSKYHSLLVKLFIDETLFPSKYLIFFHDSFSLYLWSPRLTKSPQLMIDLIMMYLHFSHIRPYISLTYALNYNVFFFSSAPNKYSF